MNEEEIFQVAAEMSAAERSAYLIIACDGQPALRQRIERLLDLSAASRFLKEGFVSTLGLGKRASDHAIVQVKNLVDERGVGIKQDRDQCGLATFDLENLQMVSCGLGAFPSKPKNGSTIYEYDVLRLT
jgi:hypothetical protein